MYVAAILAIVAGCSEVDPREDPKALHIYTWSDYIAPSVIEGFEKEFDANVVVDTFDSNEEMYERLKAGDLDEYDLIMPSSYQIDTMAREGMIDVLDHAKLPNVRKNFAPSFAGQILDPSFAYSVPYAVTYTGFAFAKGRMPDGAEVASWSILGNEALKGRVSMLDDMREVIGGALMYLGFCVNSKNPDDVAAAVEQILKWRGNVSKFDVDDYKADLASGETWLAHGYSTDVAQLMAGDPENGVPAHGDIGFALPREGFVIAFDEMVVPSGSRRKDLAHAFINYVYNAEVAADNMRFIHGPMPVAPAMDLLDDQYRAFIILDDAMLRNGQVLRSFDEYPEAQELYNRAWDRIKAADAE